MRATSPEERRAWLGRLIRNRFTKATRFDPRRVGNGVRELGCSLDGFMGYIESLWEPGMTWANHGPFGWHLDHIRPLASFNLMDHEAFAEAAHFTNYQPLWGVDNLRKGVRWSPPRHQPATASREPVLYDDRSLDEALSRDLLGE